MSKTTKAALITGTLGIIGTVVAALIGNNIGKMQGQQNALNNINSQISNVNGDNNTVNINSVDDLINSYISLQEENQNLENKNDSYFNDITELKEQISNGEEEIESLTSQLSNSPIISFSDLELCIDGNDIPINANRSMVTVDGQDYFTKEIVQNLIGKNKNLTIKDDTIFVGKVISEKAYLINQWIVDQDYVDSLQSAVDSYGNTHASSLCFNYGGYIIYNLNGNYSLLKLNLSILQNAELNRSGVLVIKADEEIVYTSPELTKTTKSFDVVDIPIKNCSLLTIEYSNVWNNKCIVSDIVVYN